MTPHPSPAGAESEVPMGVSGRLARAFQSNALTPLLAMDDKALGRWFGRFITAYQSITALSLGELWAVPIMLRLALIENLRRVAARVMASWKLYVTQRRLKKLLAEAELEKAMLKELAEGNF